MSPIPPGAVVGSASVELGGDTSAFSAAISRAASQFQRFTTGLDSRLRTFDRRFAQGFGNASKRLAAFGADLDKRLGEFDQQFNKGFGNVGRRLQGIGTGLATHVTLPLGLAGAGALAAGTKMDTLRRALLAVAGSSAEADRQFVELIEVAKLPGLGLAEAVQGSVRLQAVGISADTAARSLKAFGNAIATTGGGKAELDRLTIQLGQLSAKGKILAQDLRPIIEAAPAVGKALRDAFGTVDAQEIEELGLTTDQFIDQLLTQLEKLPKVTGGARNAFENLQDAMLRAGDAIAKTFLPIVAQLADRLSSFLIGLEKVDPGIIRWAVSLGAVAAAMGPVLIVLGQMTTAVALLSTALKVGLLPLIGVGGAVIVGLGLLAAAFLKSKLEAAALAAEHDKLVGKMTSGLASMNREQAAQHAQELGRQLERQRATLATLEAIKKTEEDAAQRRARAAARTTREGALPRITSPELDKAKTDVAEQTRVVNALAESYEKASKAATALAAAPPAPPPPPRADPNALVAARGFGPIPPPEVIERLITGLETARERLADLQFEELGITRTAEDVKKTREEITLLTRQIADLEDALAAVDVDRIFGDVPQAAITRILPVEQVRVFERSMDQTSQTVRVVGRDLKAVHDVFKAPVPPTMREEAYALAEAARQAAEEWARLLTPLQAIGMQLQGLAVMGADAFGEMGAALVEFAVSGGAKFQEFTDRLHDLFHSFIQGALRDLARLLARLALLKAIQGLFPGSAFATGFAQMIGARAAGGPVAKGEPYIVGEAGPELFVPQRAGRIVPHGTLERARRSERQTAARTGRVGRDEAARPVRTRAPSPVASQRERSASRDAPAAHATSSTIRQLLYGKAGEAGRPGAPGGGGAGGALSAFGGDGGDGAAATLPRALQSFAVLGVMDAARQSAPTTSSDIERTMFARPFASLAKAIPASLAASALLATGVSARAAGGPVEPGRTYVVGERGAEAFVPSGVTRMRDGLASLVAPAVTAHFGGTAEGESSSSSASATGTATAPSGRLAGSPVPSRSVRGPALRGATGARGQRSNNAPLAGERTPSRGSVPFGNVGTSLVRALSPLALAVSGDERTSTDNRSDTRTASSTSATSVVGGDVRATSVAAPSALRAPLREIGPTLERSVSPLAAVAGDVHSAFSTSSRADARNAASTLLGGDVGGSSTATSSRVDARTGSSATFDRSFRGGDSFRDVSESMQRVAFPVSLFGGDAGEPAAVTPGAASAAAADRTFPARTPFRAAGASLERAVLPLTVALTAGDVDAPTSTTTRTAGAPAAPARSPAPSLSRPGLRPRAASAASRPAVARLSGTPTLPSSAQPARGAAPSLSRPAVMASQSASVLSERLNSISTFGRSLERTIAPGITPVGGRTDTSPDSATSNVYRDIERTLAPVADAVRASPMASLALTLAPAASVARRASGGPVMRNMPYLVGERGPELFVPGATGNIVKNAGSGAGGAFRLTFPDLPPVPQPMTPQEAATHDFYRRLFSYLKVDYDDRGGR